MIKIQFIAQLPLVIKKRRNHFLASCLILDVHSQGETEELARKNLTEALTLFFQSCFERGTLDTVLKECSFKANADLEKTANKPAGRYDFIDISIPLFANEHEYHECRA